VVFPLNGYSNDSYCLYIMFSVLTPIQGFLNSCVYFRTRVAWTLLCNKKTSLFHCAKNTLLWPLNGVLRFRRGPASLSATHISQNRPVLQGSYFMHSFSSANLSRTGEVTIESHSKPKTDEEEEGKVEEEAPSTHDACLCSSHLSAPAQ
jgi:hypothetical protein